MWQKQFRPARGGAATEKMVAAPFRVRETMLVRGALQGESLQDEPSPRTRDSYECIRMLRGKGTPQQ